MKLISSHQRPVPIPNSFVTIKCIHRVRLNKLSTSPHLILILEPLYSYLTCLTFTRSLILPHPRPDLSPGTFTQKFEHPAQDYGENPHRELRVQHFLSENTPDAPNGHPNICKLFECGTCGSVGVGGSVHRGVCVGAWMFMRARVGG